MFAMPVHRLTYVCVASCLLTTEPTFAEDASTRWKVDKASGEVWIVTSSAQNVALTTDTQLNNGDSIRTARNGRVMLRRGEETILISPNSVVGLPAELKVGSTKIIQQAGSILLEVNKRDARTFAVETPYLVAAVKGTRFAVTVGAKGANVNVRHGSVEVADNKSGRFALVLPGQSAAVSAIGNGGLTLRGVGTLSPIQNGTPNTSPVGRVPVPRGGLTSPMTTRALQSSPTSVAGSGSAALRISAPIGQVRLDVQTATRGLAREAGPSSAQRGSQTIWNGGDGRTSPASATSIGNNPGRGDGSGNASRGNMNGNATAAANNIGSKNSGIGNVGNGNTDSGKGHGNSRNANNGNGNSASGKSDDGNGKGNNGNGSNGNANNGGMGRVENNGNGNGNSGAGNNGNGINGNGGNGNNGGTGKVLGNSGNGYGNSNGNGNNVNSNNGNGNGNGRGR